jgi:modulator of FtsH protease
MNPVVSSSKSAAQSALNGAAIGATQNKVLRNTYTLLAMTLLLSAATAAFAIAIQAKPLGLLPIIAGYFGLLFLTHKTKNSAWGILSVFALTGFMGFTLGPLVGAYWAAAPAVVMQALAGTAITFGGLSAYAVITKKDFSFMGNMLFVGILVAFLAGLGAIFFEMPALSLAVSGAFVLLMSGLILFETSRIVNGGETNYIMATVTLFVSVFNLFSSMLHLLGFAQGE